MELEPQPQELVEICPYCGRAPDECVCAQKDEWPDTAEMARPDRWVGTVLNQQYEIIELLAQGGMGSIYRARHLSLKKDRVVKMLRSDSKDAIYSKRLETEARAVGRLAHTNIVTCHDYGTAPDGTPFVVMELVDGHTLAEVLSTGGVMNPERFIEVFIQVCDALTHAHSAGILHRDLKPSNIMIVRVDGQEQVKVLDFGIAKIRGPDVTVQKLTSTGEIFGSPLYMSPEQGQGHGTDERSDVYSLGCVMYEMLAGKPPFVGDNAIETIMKHINKTVEPIPARCLAHEEPEALAGDNKLGGDVLAKLEAVVFRCLQKKPENRYATFAEIKSDLEKIKNGQLLVRLRLEHSMSGRLRRSYTPILILCVVVYVAGAAFWEFYMPGSWRAEFAAGNAVPFEPERAGVHYARALRSMPNSPQKARQQALIYIAWARVIALSGDVRHLEQSVTYFNEAIKRSDAGDPASGNANDVLSIKASALEGLAFVQLRLSKFDACIEAAMQAKEMRLKVLNQTRFLSFADTALALHSDDVLIGDALWGQGKLDKALSTYEQAESNLRRLPEAQPALADLYLKKAELFRLLGKNSQRLSALGEALALKITLLGADSLDVKRLRDEIANIKSDKID